MGNRRFRYQLAESLRLSEIHRLRILDTPIEAQFDELVQRAADALAAPIATLTLIDSDRQWFKARVGISATEGPRVTSFCSETIRSDCPLVVLDALKDRRFKSNPLVNTAEGIRFYAGAPLITAAGNRIGALCVIDVQPRAKISETERSVLVGFAAVAVGLMERRALLDRHNYAWPPEVVA